MSENGPRLTEPGTRPSPGTVASWIGPKAHGRWEKITGLIERRYPGVFTPEWLYGGKKHGWTLRYKKSRSFCTLIPEKGRCMLLIVFGAEERLKVEAVRKQLSARTRKTYDDATTYHDGKWLLLNIDNESALADAELLLSVKRRPKNAG